MLTTFQLYLGYTKVTREHEYLNLEVEKANGRVERRQKAFATPPSSLNRPLHRRILLVSPQGLIYLLVALLAEDCLTIHLGWCTTNPN
jgi:hypothetical protein